MGKSSGGTRASSAGAPRGLQSGSPRYRTVYETFIDEDTGREITIERTIDTRAEEQERIRAEKQAARDVKYEAQRASLQNQINEIEEQVTGVENELSSLREQKRIFESDMEDELGRLSGAAQDRRAAWYGSKLNSIDRKIEQNTNKLRRLGKKSDSLYRKAERVDNKLYGNINL